MVIKVIPEERIPKHIVEQTIVEQNVDVPMPQFMNDTLETMEDTPKERISECTPEQFFDAFDEPVPRFQDDPMEKQKLQAEASSGGEGDCQHQKRRSQIVVQILLTVHRIVAVNGTSSIRMSPMTERTGQLRLQDEGSAVDLAEGHDGVRGCQCCAGSAACSPEAHLGVYTDR